MHKVATVANTFKGLVAPTVEERAKRAEEKKRKEEFKAHVQDYVTGGFEHSGGPDSYGVSGGKSWNDPNWKG